MLELLIIILFIAVIISLFSSFVFLLKDVDSPSKRALYALGIRVSCATLLLGTIFYGLYSGELGSHAPWDKRLTREQVQQLHSKADQENGAKPDL